MTIQIAGFVTRADAGLRNPESITHNITPANGGVAPHYGGPKQPCAEPGADHALCISTWRAWQTYHMTQHGWVDIAYTGGFCNHGFAFAGRGAGVRTAANGTNAGNQNYYAVVWIGGEGQTPTDAAYDAADWWIDNLRKAGAGMGVKPHRFFKKTGCPGDPFVNFAKNRDGKAIESAPKDPNAIGPDVVMTQKIQHLLKLTPTGTWGPETDIRAELMVVACMSRVGWPANQPMPHHKEGVQMIIGVSPNGNFDKNSQIALHAWVQRLQRVLGVSVDGLWGPETYNMFAAVREANRV